MSLAKSESEREAFLADVHIGVIAVDRDGCGPLAVPIWYDYREGGEVVLWTERGSVKERLIRTAGRFSLCAQVEEPPYRYVSVEGPVVGREEEPSFEQVREIASRYMTPEEATKYVEQNASDEFVLIRMKPERWLSMDESKA